MGTDAAALRRSRAERLQHGMAADGGARRRARRRRCAGAPGRAARSRCAVDRGEYSESDRRGDGGVHDGLPRPPRQWRLASRGVLRNPARDAGRRPPAVFVVRSRLLRGPLSMAGEFADIVVLIPGITGSVLERNGREVWGTSIQAGLRGLFSGGRTIQDLLLEHDDPDADDLGDGVRATRLIHDVHLFPGLWTIDGYTKVAERLLQRLRLTPGTNYFELPYDWRRTNQVASRKLDTQSTEWLAARRKTHPDAKLVIVAHSMGGLVARHFLEVLGGWRNTRMLVTFGTPY